MSMRQWMLWHLLSWWLNKHTEQMTEEMWRAFLHVSAHIITNGKDQA